MTTNQNENNDKMKMKLCKTNPYTVAVYRHPSFNEVSVFASSGKEARALAREQVDFCVWETKVLR